MGNSVYPTELLAKAKYEQNAFDRVASDTGQELIQEVERLRLLVALHVAPMHVAAMAKATPVAPVAPSSAAASTESESPNERDAAKDAHKEVATDTQRLDWLNENYSHDEKDQWDARRHEGFSKWKFFAPEGVANDIRRVIDAAVADEKASRIKPKSALPS